MTLKRRISLGLIGVLALTGVFSTAGQVATTQDSAEALTKYSCSQPYLYYGYWFRTCYYDYNWYEESWWGGSKRDGWYREHTVGPIYWR